MKSNLKNQQQTNSGYPAGAAGIIPNKNFARLAFTANNFYDSKNANQLNGSQNYGMRQGNEQQFQHSQNSSIGSAAPRQSRSRQKVMKTNTYGVTGGVTNQGGEGNI